MHAQAMRSEEASGEAWMRMLHLCGSNHCMQECMDKHVRTGVISISNVALQYCLALSSRFPVLQTA